VLLGVVAAGGGAGASRQRGAAGATTVLVSVNSSGQEASDGSFWPSPSADGRYVAFYSYASNLVPHDTNDARDVFVRDLELGVTERVSVSSTGHQTRVGGYAFPPSISADGRYVAFVSGGANLVADDTNGHEDVFVRDLELGVTERVSVSSSGHQTHLGGSYPSISADGRYVAFVSGGANLAPHDTNGKRDVFVRDLQLGVTRRVSVSSTGEHANGHSALPSISADGRFVAFGSDASNLVPHDTNGYGDVFVRDRKLGVTRRVSVSSSGEQADDESNYGAAISADGHYVAFTSYASNMPPHDASNGSGVFLRGPL
jgi:Tol biopolymer transport system component